MATETIADIVREMKSYINAEAFTKDYDFVSIDELADRIEAAYKREVEKRQEAEDDLRTSVEMFRLAMAVIEHDAVANCDARAMFGCDSAKLWRKLAEANDLLCNINKFAHELLAVENPYDGDIDKTSPEAD